VEVFLAAFKNVALSSLTAEHQLPWSLRIARNKVVDRHRHLALLPLVPIELAREMEDGAPTPEQYEEECAHAFTKDPTVRLGLFYWPLVAENHQRLRYNIA
jgi:DNA-directed RNA polymerase specialized sigma24 family protein